MRLNILKATLREWRSRFAYHLRQEGIAANATDRFVRGETKSHKLDGIYRPMSDPQRFSTHMQERVGSVAADHLEGGIRVEPAKVTLARTRKEVERGWRAVIEILESEGRTELAHQVRKFVTHMPPAQTEKEQIKAELLKLSHGDRAHHQQPVR